MKVNGTLSGTEGSGNSIYGGDMFGGFLRMQNRKDEKTGLFGKSQEVTEQMDVKKAEIRKKVMRMMGDRFAQDSRDYYNDIEKAGNQISQSREIIGEMNGKIGLLRDTEEAMRKELGITKDSQEHQDVEFLIKMGEVIDANKKPEKKDLRMSLEEGLKEIARLAESGSDHRGRWSSLTGEEWERAVELSGKPVTPYQETCISNKIMEKYYKSDIEEEEKKIRMASGELFGIKLALLKQHGMADTLAQIEEVEKAGAKEIIGMLIEESMDHVKEDLEEDVEEAREAAEEKEEQEEKVENNKTEASPQEEQTWEIVGQVMDQEHTIEQTKEKIVKILEEAKLLEEDLKGIQVDQKT